MRARKRRTPEQRAEDAERRRLVDEMLEERLAAAIDVIPDPERRAAAQADPAAYARRQVDERIAALLERRRASG